jgi:7-carboxy-7-deazaguanine synthase
VSTQDQTIRISEIFGPTIQGEGTLIGLPTVFVRTGGCDYRCSWCDTLHAVESAYRHEWKEMTPENIWAQIRHLSGGVPLTVSLSGGNPAIQPLEPLIRLGKTEGYRFALETQGSIAQDWFAFLDVLTLSPKPPSSNMDTDWSVLESCIRAAGPQTDILLKIVVFDDKDYAYAKTVSKRHPEIAICLQPGNAQVTGVPDMGALHTKMCWLVAKTLEDQWFQARVLPQLHVMLWGNKRGV